MNENHTKLMEDQNQYLCYLKKDMLQHMYMTTSSADQAKGHRIFLPPQTKKKYIKYYYSKKTEHFNKP